MSLFQTGNQITPELRANRQLAKANSEFDRLVSQSQSDFNQFWTEFDGVTPIQVIEAMGTKAQSFFAVAYIRVQMLLQVAQAMGKPELVNEADFLPPYTLTFKADGSLDSAVPK
jgi:cyclopropane fatty-acyl-phospholipid synthase-like methyltransferase